MKYDTEIDFHYNNTMSLIAEWVKKESVVLEFGSASGRLTKYLKEEKNCKVSIVEIDEESGKIAAAYAEHAFVGSAAGDINNDIWCKELSEKSFDYIIFADVLEHLYDPESVLLKTKRFLKEDGHILISIPNLCHNSVLLGMMQNEFVYKETGILDNTHIRFWTQDTFEAMLARIEFFVAQKYATYTQVGLNEFSYQYGDVPEEVSKFLKTRPYGECYQFVYDITMQKTECKDHIVRFSDYYYAQAFFLLENETFVDEYSEKFLVNHDEEEFIINVPAGCKKVRFDPLNAVCIVELMELTCDGIMLEKTITSNAAMELQRVYVFDTDDSQITFDNREEKACQYKIKVRYSAVENRQTIKLASAFQEEFAREKNIVEQKENYICEQRERISERDNTIRELNGVIEQKENYICKQRENISERDNTIRELNGVIEQKENYICEQREVINNQEEELDRLHRFMEKTPVKILYQLFSQKKA